MDRINRVVSLGQPTSQIQSPTAAARMARGDARACHPRYSLGLKRTIERKGQRHMDERGFTWTNGAANASGRSSAHPNQPRPPMSLSPASLIVIDLILLTDAVRAKDTEEAHRLARRLEKTARNDGSSGIAKQARGVQLLLLLGTPLPEISVAVHELLIAAERSIYCLPSHGADWEATNTVNPLQGSPLPPLVAASR